MVWRHVINEAVDKWRKRLRNTLHIAGVVAF